MLAPAELAVQVSLTEVFISADPVDLVVTLPGNKIPDGAGGWIHTPSRDVAVWGRLIPQSDMVPTVDTAEGNRPAPVFVLVCLPDAEVVRYAKFRWMEQDWEISKMHYKPEYELKADVILSGG